MKKGDLKQITILDDNGQEYRVTAEFLGRGSFATCFIYNGFVYSFLKENNQKEFDYSKEAIVQWADSDNPHIPDYKYLGDIKNLKLYKSTLYKELTKESNQAWNDFKIISEKAEKELKYNTKFNFETNRKFIDSLVGLVSEDIVNALHNMNDSMCNYANYYMMEFPKRNLKVDDKGNLIFLDVFFNPKALRWYKS